MFNKSKVFRKCSFEIFKVQSICWVLLKVQKVQKPKLSPNTKYWDTLYVKRSEIYKYSSLDERILKY